MRTVLIFAHECSPHNRPESTIGAQRPAQFAKYLAEHGWRAIVICRDAAHDRRLDRLDVAAIHELVRRQLAEASSDECVVVATPSLKRDGLLDGLWHWSKDCKFPGVGLLCKLFTILKFFTGDYSQSWQPCARVAAEEVRRHVGVDCCVGEHSPDAGLFVARWYASTHCVPWVADFRDRIACQFGPRARRLYLPAARRLLSSAKALINVTPVWAEMDQTDFGIPASCITNGYDPAEFSASNARESAHDTFTVFAAGKLNVGWSDPKEVLALFLKGVRLFLGMVPESRRNRVRFVFRGNGSDAVREAVRDHDLSGNADIEGFSPRAEILRSMQAADLLLLTTPLSKVDRHVFSRKGMYPGKVFEYFGARRPILCIPGDNGILDELLRETGTGVSLAMPQAIADFLIEAYDSWATAGDVQFHPNSHLVAEYSRPAGARKLAAILNQVCREG